MADLRSIRRRISSIKSSQKISEAMRMVSTARFTRLEQRLKRQRQYMERLGECVGRMVAMAQDEEEPAPPGKRALTVLFSSDRGLCAGFNHNLVAWFMASRDGASHDEELWVIGRQGISALREKGVSPARTFTKLWDGRDTAPLKTLFHDVTGAFERGEFDRVELVYNRFHTFLTQTPIAVPLYPVVGLPVVTDAEVEFEADPGYSQIEEVLFPYYSEYLLYLVAIDALTAEHAARMNAMSNASRNASELLEKLRLTYNKIRQEKITRELIEIISGTEALS